MKKLLRSNAAKVLAFVLCLATAMSCLGCAFGFFYNYMETENVAGEKNFASSDLARAYVNRNIWTVLYEAREGQTSDFYVWDGDFTYAVFDPDGELIADTRGENSVEVPGFWEQDGYMAIPCVNLPASRGSRLHDYTTLYDFLYDGRDRFLPLTIALGVLTLALFIFLMAAAGRTPEGVRLGGLHRWPLELYLGPLVGLGAYCLYLTVYFADQGQQYPMLMFLGIAGGILCAGTMALLACMTLSARFRAGKWWRNTIVFYVLRFVWRLGKRIWRGLGQMLRAVPLGWKAGLAFAAVIGVNGFLLLLAFESHNGGFWVTVLILADFAGLLASFWMGAQLQELRKGALALAQGDLNHQIDTTRLRWDMKAHAQDLNAVREGMSRAVEERMRSERFKTELITNVSHDLKTPLTSIVSYVELLKQEDIPGEKAREYIDVLDRQSQRLRKLTADLVEASKASSGVLAVNRERIELRELLRQSAGEYAQRFAQAGIEPVLTLPEEECAVTADGRLVWRVLDNLLGNVTKYALSGTRCYIAAAKTPEGCRVEIKNISRESLNIPAEELLERFVRGDVSRSTEGSGLGLSIAKSLMELMGGELRLTLDGDLFKAELLFSEK